MRSSLTTRLMCIAALIGIALVGTAGAQQGFRINGLPSMVSHLLFSPTNTYDIGTDSATLAPRTVYAGTSFVTAAGGSYLFAGQGGLTSPADGKFQLAGSSSTTPMLLLGGATSSFPALKRSTTILQARLADDSAYATVDALAYQASGAAGVTGTCDTPTFTGGVATTCGGAGGSVDGTYYVTTNFTTAANTNFQLITGLAWTFPVSTALTIPFRCSLVYSQATAAVSDSLGIQDVTVAPTNGMFTGSAETALGTTAYGDLVAHASTTATAVVTFTPSATATTFNAYIDGLIEQPSNGSSSAFQIQIKTTASADAITIYRGSYCKVG